MKWKENEGIDEKKGVFDVGTRPLLFCEMTRFGFSGLDPWILDAHLSATKDPPTRGAQGPQRDPHHRPRQLRLFAGTISILFSCVVHESFIEQHSAVHG